MSTAKTHTQDLDVSRAPHGKFGGHELAAGGWTGGSSMVGWLWMVVILLTQLFLVRADSSVTAPLLHCCHCRQSSRMEEESTLNG